MSDDTERREFLKTAGAAALGGIAVSALSGTEAAAQPMMAGKRLTVYARPNVTIDELFAAFRTGLGRTGCPTCGLMGGFGVLFTLGDPPEVIATKGNVAGVTLTTAAE